MRAATPTAAMLVLAAQSALAQDLATRIKADLDGDGLPETFALSTPDENGDVDLVVDAVSGGLTIHAAAWSGPMAGQEAYLALGPAGGVQLVSGNDAVGRGRWFQVVTIAHRDGALRVAGVTYSWRDTLDPEAGGTCDLNLLSGRGVVQTAAGARDVAAPPSVPLSEWRGAASVLPPVCGG